jgi:hypothetical protein
MQADDESHNSHQEKNAIDDSDTGQSERATDHKDNKSDTSPSVPGAKWTIAWPAAVRNFFWRVVAGLKAIDGLITAIATVAVAFATVFLYYATRDLVEDAKHAFEIANRAWVAPISIGLASTLEKGKPISIGLRYENVGKVPAIDLHEHYAIFSPPDTAMDDGSAMAFVDKNDVCDGVEPWKDAQVLYPGAGGTTLTLSLKPIDPKTGKGVPLYDDFMSGNHSVIVQFCIAYKTLEATHKSAFCYFYRPNIATSTDLARCDKGNHAT